MGKQYVICPRCGANLDFGERCDCQKVEIHAEEIPDSAVRSLSRPLLAAARRFYEDPQNMANFEKWQADRERRPAKRGA